MYLCISLIADVGSERLLAVDSEDSLDVEKDYEETQKMCGEHRSAGLHIVRQVFKLFPDLFGSDRPLKRSFFSFSDEFRNI